MRALSDSGRNSLCSSARPTPAKAAKAPLPADLAGKVRQRLADMALSWDQALAQVVTGG